jgi:hypothetical protein
MEEIITEYIVSASHLDQLRAIRGEVGAIYDATGSRSSSRDDPFSPGRGMNLATKLSPPLVSLATAGGGGFVGSSNGGGCGNLHHRIATVLDGMRCHSAVLRSAVREHEAPDQRESLSRSLRVRPGRLAPSELFRGPLSPSQWTRSETRFSGYSPDRRNTPASTATGRARPVSAAVALLSPPRDSLPHMRPRRFSYTT